MKYILSIYIVKHRLYKCSNLPYVFVICFPVLLVKSVRSQYIVVFICQIYIVFNLGIKSIKRYMRNLKTNKSGIELSGQLKKVKNCQFGMDLTIIMDTVLTLLKEKLDIY